MATQSLTEYLERTKATRSNLSEKANAYYLSIMNESISFSPTRPRRSLHPLDEKTEEVMKLVVEDNVRRGVGRKAGMGVPLNEVPKFTNLKAYVQSAVHKSPTVRQRNVPKLAFSSSHSPQPSNKVSSSYDEILSSPSDTGNRLSKAYNLKSLQSKRFTLPPHVNYLIPRNLRENTMKLDKLKPVLMEMSSKAGIPGKLISNQKVYAP